MTRPMTEADISVAKLLPGGDAIAVTDDGTKVYIPPEVARASQVEPGHRRGAKLIESSHPRHSKYVPYVAAFVGIEGSATPSAFAQSLPAVAWMIEEDGEAVWSDEPPEEGEESCVYVKFG